MDSCEETRARMTAHLDGEEGDAERRAVDSHLGVCPSCRTVAAVEGTARRVLHVKASSLAVTAPAPLRARCAALASTRTVASAGWSFRRPLALGSAVAAGLLLAVVTYGVATHSPVLLAAELTLDHLKCFAFFDSAPGEASAASAEATILGRFGWRVTVPPGGYREGLVLTGARRCLSHDGSVAHLMYRHSGRPVSLFIVPDGQVAARDLAIAGYPARVWSTGGLTYVLVGSEPGTTLAPVARYFEAALR